MFHDTKHVYFIYGIAHFQQSQMGFDGSHLRCEFTAFKGDIVMSFPENHGITPPVSVSGNLEIPHLDLQFTKDSTHF